MPTALFFDRQNVNQAVGQVHVWYNCFCCKYSADSKQDSKAASKTDVNGRDTVACAPQIMPFDKQMPVGSHMHMPDHTYMHKAIDTVACAPCLCLWFTDRTQQWFTDRTRQWFTDRTLGENGLRWMATTGLEKRDSGLQTGFT